MPLNAANLLTLARVVLVPVMVLLVIGDEAGALHAAAAVFGVAAVTDAADGHIARARDMVTTFGRLMDPVADKLLVGVALGALVAVDRLALWIALVIVLRDVGVSALRWYAGTRGIVIAVSPLGKAKTGMQMVAIPLLMLVPVPTAAWVDALALAVAAVTVASGVQYGLTYLRRAAEGPVGAVPAPDW